MKPSQEQGQRLYQGEGGRKLEPRAQSSRHGAASGGGKGCFRTADPKKEEHMHLLHKEG